MPVTHTAEPFRGQYGVLTSADRWYAVTPHDTDVLPIKPRMVHANVGGTIAMVGADGVTATWTFQDGAEKALSPVRILATGTTATGIVVAY